MSRFSDNILTAARRLKDERTAATDNTLRFSSARLVALENEAIREVVKDVYANYREQFGDVMPEMMKTSSAIDITATRFARPSDCWLVLTVKNEAGDVLYQRLKDSEVEPVRTGRHGLIVPTANNPRFWQEGEYIYLLPTTLSGKVIPRYIMLHTNMTIAGAEAVDIILANYWDGDIVDKMVELAKKDLE